MKLSREVKRKQTNNKVGFLFVSFLLFVSHFFGFFCAFCQKHENRLPVRNGKYSCTSVCECAWVCVSVCVSGRASNVWLIEGRKLIVFSKQTLHKRMWIHSSRTTFKLRFKFVFVYVFACLASGVWMCNANSQLRQLKCFLISFHFAFATIESN